MKPFPGTTGDARRTIAIGVVLAAVYVTAAKLGFLLAFSAEQVTTVWAPTGIAQAALLLWGRALWPAVWIGAFVANAGTNLPPWAAAGVATGNTLEALAAVWLLRGLPSFDVRLRRLRDAVAFIILGSIVSTAISATIGVSMLCLSSAQPWSRFPALLSDWWLGDGLGSLIVAPAILTVARTPRLLLRKRWMETALLATGAVAAMQLVFGLNASGRHPIEYLVFPFVIAAAVRLTQPATSLVVLGASAATIWHALRAPAAPGAGDVYQGLILVQAFMGVLAGTGLLLAAATAERRTIDRRRAAAHAVGVVLAGATTIDEAAPGILRAICANIGWQVSALWLLDRDAQRLRCVALWRDPAVTEGAFVELTRRTTFPIGVGLPGRVWSSVRPAWIEDVVRDANFPRAAAAREDGLHGAFGFPIGLGDEVLGVIECFNLTVVTLDADLLRTMGTVGHQVGQFIGRTQVEAAMREEQRHTRAILDTAVDAIIGMDHAGVITEFNPAAERMFGHTREQAIGNELAGLLIPEALRDHHRAGLARYLATGTGGFIDRHVETTAARADGRTFPVEVAITRVSDGDPPRFTGFVRDSTVRAQTEREREALLQRELSALREAEAANRAKDEFLATLSHELRTPLNAILGWTRMLLDGTLDERSQLKALQVIDRNAHLQAQLVGDILDVSRTITGGLRLELQPVDLGSIIGASLDAVRPAADARGVQLRSRLEASARLTEGDPQRLQQIVWNLLANAVKFTPSGGVVQVGLVEVDGGVRIVVEDNGAGIDAGFLPHAFERFRQADGSISRRHGGLGLGLAIVRHLVELHGGTVRAASAGLGMGSTFTVDLPRLDQTLAASMITSPPASVFDTGRAAPRAVLKGCRALVVDDEDDARDLISAILTGAGASVETAPTVADALRSLDVSIPDVLLADLGMPGADGFVLIREVRRRESVHGRRLPAAAITAYAGNVDRERTLAAGFDRHIAKPISKELIIDTVRALVPPHRQIHE